MKFYTKLLSSFLFLLLSTSLQALAISTEADSLMPVRGLCIGAPDHDRVDDFITFINKELVPRRVNTLILMVNFGYQFQSHPELADSGSLTKEDVKKMVATCKINQIRLIPELDLLGHQSWAGRVNNLLRVYPEFDETPWIKMPEKYAWPNADELYCKSYCPLHPTVHRIVFDLVDELCEVFEATAFHAGMDEVFYLAENKCPRCAGHDPAELFAGEVTAIRNHLALKNRELWIWGDRLIDGRTTGLGMWEASFNNTYRAIDLIPKDVFICDWHYERPDPTAVYFAAKGFRVAACPWRDPSPAVQQVQDMFHFRQTATPEMRERYCGIIQTVWDGAESFIRGFNEKPKDRQKGKDPVDCFQKVFSQIEQEMKNLH